jgi:hypothetical protein
VVEGEVHGVDGVRCLAEVSVGTGVSDGLWEWLTGWSPTPIDALLRSRALRSRRLVAARTIATRTTSTLIAAWATARPALTAARSAPTATLAALSAAAALSRTRWARRFEGLLLLGRQYLIELGLGLFFEFGNLFLLIFREVQLLDRERRDQMEPAPRTAGTIAARRAAGATAARTSNTRTTVWPARKRRASLVQDLLLHGRQDLVELGLRLSFEFGDPFMLIGGQVHLVRREGRN